MFNPKYKITLTCESFPKDDFICLGSQLATIVGSMKCLLPSHAWYGADVQGVGKNACQYDIEGFRWGYQSKRMDATGLVYFGARHYDPSLGRFLTTDPAGFEDSYNLYQYVLNNPFRYHDPNGENLLGFLLGVGQIIAGGAIMATGVALEIGTFGGYTLAFGLHESVGLGLMASGLATTTYHAQDISFRQREVEVYYPDRKLPRDPRTKEPTPETDAPHTQLGTNEGRKGKYPQAREFDEKGKPVRDIDFTDHGRPQNHPMPHQHEHIPNPTGGTPSRDPVGKPVEGWNY